MVAAKQAGKQAGRQAKMTQRRYLTQDSKYAEKKLSLRFESQTSH